MAGESIVPEVTNEVVPVVEVFTFKQIVDMPAEEMRNLRKNPEKAEAMDKVIADHYAARKPALEEIVEDAVEPVVEEVVTTPEEKAAEDAARAEAEKAEAERVAAEAASAEADRLAAEAARAEAEKRDLEEKARLAAEEAAKPKQKIVREYQAKDEEGNPIGRPTHLEADTWEEMSQKQEEAHVQATRAFHRLKNRRDNVTKAPAPVMLPSDEELLQAANDLDGKDPVKRLEAIKKISAAEAEKARAEARAAKEQAEGARITYEWLQKHIYDYNNCKANTDLIVAYFKENNLDWTANNLDLALIELDSQLAPVVRQAEPIPVPTPKPVAEIKPESVAVNPVPAPAPVVASAPVAAAPTPVEPPVAAPNAPAPVRKLPAGGIEPGSLHGARPASKLPALTKQDIAKMSKEEFKTKLKDPNFRKQLNAIGIKA